MKEPTEDDPLVIEIVKNPCQSCGFPLTIMTSTLQRGTIHGSRICSACGFPLSQRVQKDINTPGLLNEIMSNDQCAILRRPLQLLGNLLGQVGQRAAELNDPQLNRLMCLLALYSIADPYSPDYDERRVQEVLAVAAKGEREGWARLKEDGMSDEEIDRLIKLGYVPNDDNWKQALQRCADRHGVTTDVRSPTEFFEAHGFWPDGYNPDLVGARNVAKLGRGEPRE